MNESRAWVLLSTFAGALSATSCSVERGVPSYTLLQLKDGTQTYLQQYVLPNRDYDAGHVELFSVGADAVARKVAQTSRGDFRVMARLGLLR